MYPREKETNVYAYGGNYFYVCLTLSLSFSLYKALRKGFGSPAELTADHQQFQSPIHVLLQVRNLPFLCLKTNTGENKMIKEQNPKLLDL